MGSRRHIRKIYPKQFIKKSPQQFLLDQFSISDIRKWQAVQDEVLKFHWDRYSNLAYQRSKIADQITNVLLEAVEKDFLFERWQRSVKYKYALEPFSMTGSIIDPGGRFNIGDINASQFPPFPALYIASDKHTALQELLSQKIIAGQENKALDFALANPSSIASISLSGKIDSVINLRQPEKLQPFVDLIKDFTVPEHLKESAKKIGLAPPELITTVSKLIDSLSIRNWRLYPMQLDIPTSSQVFGQLIADAGIEGILYASKFTDKDCLAIFPQNFDEPAGSCIQLDDEAPPEIKIRRLDAKVWSELQKAK